LGGGQVNLETHGELCFKDAYFWVVEFSDIAMLLLWGVKRRQINL
jgi:hypothetical protein